MSQYIQTEIVFTMKEIIELGKDLSTFKLKGYQITGDKVIHPETQERILLKEIMNEIRNVRNEKQELIAKRRTPNGKLLAVKNKPGKYIYAQTSKEFTLKDIIEFGKDLSTFKVKDLGIVGDKVIHPITGESVLIQDIFEDIRNVRNNKNKIIAKRKHSQDKLLAVRKSIRQ